MAAFTSNIDITSGGTYGMNITNGMPASQVANDLNGKFANIQKYLQDGLPEVWTGDTLPDSLNNGKICRWNNDGYMYIGNSLSQPVKIANYENITSLQNQIAGLSFDAGGVFKIWTVSNKRDTLASIIDFEPSACLLFMMDTNTPNTIQNWFSFDTAGLQWWHSVDSSQGTSYRQTSSSIRTMRFDELIQTQTNPTYPVKVACIIWK